MKYLLTILLVMVAVQASAVEIEFHWTANTDSTVGYYIYMDSGSNKIVTVEGKEHEEARYILTDGEDECHSFYMTAYNSDKLESVSSDIATWCPKVDLPATPSMFFINVIPPRK